MRGWPRGALLVFLAASFPLQAQAPDSAQAVLERAYELLQAHDYDEAIAQFRRGLALSPENNDARQDLAYTLLKVGENEEARELFRQAMERNPGDAGVALEYAFLCYETRKKREARLVFDRVRRTAAGAAKATAEEAFENIDRPLREGISRWREAVAREPDNFSAHRELAELLEDRDQPAEAAAHYETAWRLKPAERKLLVDLGRAWRMQGRQERAIAALLAASRGAEPRAAETARQLLPSRYPYVYEFRAALELDAGNVELRREFAYLLLEMGNRQEAEREFQQIVEQAPGDLLSSAQLGFLRLQRRDIAGARPLLDAVLKATPAGAEELQDRVREALKLPKVQPRTPEGAAPAPALSARAMAERSYQAGYLEDALKYLTVAHEEDPLDFAVILKLGWTHNLLRQDQQAMDWFALARNSPDAKIAAEARRAYENLEPEQGSLRTTFWITPFYSTRWKSAFGYSQLKSEIRLGSLPFRPYLSLRLVGDSSPLGGPAYPQYLSESAFILGAGLATQPWKGLMAWGEAGTSVSYQPRADSQNRALPDYRGGLSFGKGIGKLPGGSEAGGFYENHEDAVFVARFDNTFMVYCQNKAGYSFSPARALGGLTASLYANFNATGDTKRQYWANFVEAGPGLRFRFAFLPRSFYFSVDALRGVHLVNDGNPRRPNYYDLRAGFWYAFSK